jgi:uncharacterized protein (TIGR04255 family)
MGTDISFNYPPVVETVLSIQFERLRGLTNAHLGAFWQQKSQEWPQVSDAPPLDEQVETFGKQPAWNKAFRLKLTQAPSARVQMRNANGDRMIQLQNCRLAYNWISKPEQQYPRYSVVRPEFDKILAEFQKLAVDHHLEDIVPNQWEVTYVNHIPKDTVWTKPEDWSTLFNSLPGLAAVPTGMRLEGFGGHWHFEIESQRGRLHVELQHAFIGESEKQEALIMKLTARGPIDKDTDDKITAIDEGLNLGHDVIIRSFVALTSQRTHEYWNREIL